MKTNKFENCASVYLRIHPCTNAFCLFSIVLQFNLFCPSYWMKNKIVYCCVLFQFAHSNPLSLSNWEKYGRFFSSLSLCVYLDWVMNKNKSYRFIFVIFLIILAGLDYHTHIQHSIRRQRRPHSWFYNEFHTWYYIRHRTHETGHNKRIQINQRQDQAREISKAIATYQPELWRKCMETGKRVNKNDIVCCYCGWGCSRIYGKPMI